MTTEQYLAGSLLIDEQAIGIIKGICTEDDFQSEHCRAVFSAAMNLYSAGEAIDPVSIQKCANRNGTDLTTDLLVELMDCTPTAANCVEYAHRVAEDARSRRIKDLAFRIQTDETMTSDELLAMLQRETDAIRGGSFQRCLLSPAETLRRFSTHVVDSGNGRQAFVRSGFVRLDQILGGGFIRGGLYILGARPAVGKSTFAVNLADTIRGNVLLISLEMSPEQIIAKRVARITGLSVARLLSGHVSDDDWTKIADASSDLSEQGVYLNDTYGMTVNQIQLMAQAVPNLNAVIIDYLGLIHPATRGGSTYENISAISRELKRMALSLNVPIICLSQLSRAVESREDKRPRLSDLRDSGAIEQDADAVMFLYRADYYDRAAANTNCPSLVQLDIAKNRHGRTGQTEFSFWLAQSCFKEVP